MAAKSIMIMIATGATPIVHVAITTLHVVNVGMEIVTGNGTRNRTVKMINGMLLSKTMSGTTQGKHLTTLIMLIKMIISQELHTHPIMTMLKAFRGFAHNHPLTTCLSLW
jgi:hypothetical protein